MNLLKDMVTLGKNKALAGVLGPLVDSALSRYGRVTELKINSESRMITLNLLLKGESQPLHIEIVRWDVIHDNDTPSLVVHEISVSKEWLHQLALDLVIGRPISIPSRYAGLLDFLI